MTRDETFKLLSIIKASYRNSGLDSKNSAEMQQTINAWAVMLEDVPYNVAIQAVKMHTSVSPYPPTISEIRQRAQQLTSPESMMTAEEVWDMTVKAVRRYGRYRIDEALEKMPTDVRSYVKRWYIDICNSEELDVIRGQFIKNYEITAKRDREMKQFPKSIQKILLQGAMALQIPER